MQNESIRKLIGRGISFPFVPNNASGVATNELVDRINQSLFILFETPKGSRLMLPDFGSDIQKFRFDPLDRVLLERLRYTINEDIKKWEPRVIVTSIEFLEDTNMIDNSILYISIYYNIINTPVSGNYVYPFKRENYDSVDSRY